MVQDIQRSRGRPQNYKLDRGGVPAEFGPFKGIVMNNVDPTRMGRLEVYIEAFSDGDQNVDNKWITVDYLPQYFGSTPKAGSSDGAGSFPGNRNTYGMWWTPPDVGVEVICIFVDGDRNKGYYIGVVPDQGANFMVPAIGASENFVPGNENQQKYFARATRVPATEINDSNPDVINAPKFYDLPRPVQSVQAGAMFQQGVITDNFRGPISSSAQRESPSQSFGFSSPGRPVYQGGFTQEELIKRIDEGAVRPQDTAVIGRLGGHTLVMDDGAVDGTDQLVRIRTSKGHQIMMHDSGDFFHIMHANGQTWIELGKEGTVDVFSTNSVNVRTQGTINLHADQDINMYAGRNIKMRADQGNVTVEAKENIACSAENGFFKAFGKEEIGMLSNGKIALKGATASWGASGGMKFQANRIDLNGPNADNVIRPIKMSTVQHKNVVFSADTGWTVQGTFGSIVTRAPTHEPWPGHIGGVANNTNMQANSGTVTPSSTPVPGNTSVTGG